MTRLSTVDGQPRQAAAVDVILCADLAEHAALDLTDLRHRLSNALREARIVVAGEVCARPRQLGELAERAGSRRLVLGLCRGAYERRALQAAVRKSDLDIFAVEEVVVAPSTTPPSPEATEELVLRFRAAAARLAAFTGSAPEELRLRLLPQGEPVSRRSLLALPPVTYEAIAGIDEDACLGRKSCGLCARACPARAIAPSGNSLVVDRTACIACGVCVSTCPVGAVTFPGSSLAQYEAELDVLLSAPQRPIAFACRRALESRERIEAPSSEPDFRSVEVPCLGTVTVGWILQTLAAGAPAVKLLSCGAECRADRWPIMRSRVDYVRRLLAELGEDAPSERVQIATEAQELSGAPPQLAHRRANALPHITLNEPQASAEALRQLQERYGVGKSVQFSHPESPIGLVDLREETCTTCGTCADVCPTGALDVTDQVLTRQISFDPKLCVACGRCASFCPEAAFDTLSVERATRTDELERGRRTLARSTQTPCERCGRPVAPSAMLDRIELMLEDTDGSEELLKTLRRLCSDCRGLVQESPAPDR